VSRFGAAERLKTEYCLVGIVIVVDVRWETFVFDVLPSTRS
jgi:hypothetical protein